MTKVMAALCVASLASAVVVAPAAARNDPKDCSDFV
jgi:hypothetical protein